MARLNGATTHGRPEKVIILQVNTMDLVVAGVGSIRSSFIARALNCYKSHAHRAHSKAPLL